ncbi:MAG TPA: DUF547 domain-containing protein [Burkholderiaceae bacterium]|nr:DUF547 domain-containing protein [Burkholderiaceae bacterium]
MQLTRRQWLTLVPMLGSASAGAQAFDHTYAAWGGLLKKHVRWLADNKQSRVAYAGMAADRDALKSVLTGFSALTPAAYAGFSRTQQMAFLINAYNAFTIELVLTEYPNLKSIKDVGSIVRSPWKKPFYTLLGETRNLDWIEHEQLRPRYNDPRIHTAIVCASIGCPALKPEPYTAERLDEQLEDGMRRFLGDRTRNRAGASKLEVSSIFKWFREDFEKGHQGFRQVEDVFARYAAQLSDEPAVQEQLKARQLAPQFLDYDWSLNDAGR